MTDSSLSAPPAPFRTMIAWTAWPGLLAICVAITAYGFKVDHPALFFNVAYALLAVCLYTLERTMPHERGWNENDGQTFANIAHTLTSKGVVQSLVIFSAVIGLTVYITPAAQPGYGIWPRAWPMAAQVVLAVGAPMEVLTWLSAVTAFIGMLTHCNVDMRFGPLSWWFNTPELHRWHHSKDLREGNKNYSENVMLWDHLFGTYYNSRDYRPPADIGINEPMPPGFLQQLAWPFKKR